MSRGGLGLGARISTAAVVILLSVITSGCTGFPNRQQQADGIVAKLRATPGVESAHANYVNGIDRGASFEVSVEVDRTIASPALADIGRQFVDQVDHADFSGHLLSLRIGFPISGPGSDWNNRSGASFNLTDDIGARLKDVSANQVDADLRFWLELVNFPGVTSAELHRPAQQSSRDGRSRLLYARVVNGDAGIALQTRYPELQNRWQT
jgi:hypothetical protein